jgi:hypothetical protein
MTDETHQLLLLANNLLGVVLVFLGVDWYLRIME